MLQDIFLNLFYTFQTMTECLIVLGPSPVLTRIRSVLLRALLQILILALIVTLFVLLLTINLLILTLLVLVPLNFSSNLFPVLALVQTI